MEKCKYGCGKIGQFEIAGGLSCSKYSNQCDAIKAKNSRGLILAHKNGLKNNSFSFSDDDRVKSTINRINNLKKQPFEVWGYKLTRTVVLDEQEGVCAICNNGTTWNNLPLVFELDHIDGDNGNNSRENVRMICPNCHSQTNTFRGRNINSGQKKVTDLDLLQALEKNKSISGALKSVGLAPKGGNYDRVRRLLNNSSNTVNG